MESRSLVRQINEINKLHADNETRTRNTVKTSGKPQGGSKKSTAGYQANASQVGYKPRTSQSGARSAAGTRSAAGGNRSATGARTASGTRKAVSASSKARSVDASRNRRKAARRREAIVYTVAAVAVLAVLGVVIGILLWHFSFTKIALSDYLQVDFSGYDTHGVAEVHMDVGPGSPDFWSAVETDVDKSENLKNGDEITVSFAFDEEVAKESKLKVDGTEIVVTVEGLDERTLIDANRLFSGLSVTQNGLSPRVSLTVENTSEDEFVSQITYEIDSDKSFYADGEEVAITALIPEELAQADEYAFELGESGNMHIHTVSEPDSYVMDSSFITADVLKRLEDDGMQILLDSDANEYGLRIFQQEAHMKAVFVGNRTTFKWTGAYVISAYFHSVTEAGIQFIENHTNDVQVVYGVTITQQDGSKAFVEAVVQFTNIILRADGTVDLSESPGRLVSCTYKDKNVKSLVSGANDVNYDTVKLEGQ